MQTTIMGSESIASWNLDLTMVVAPLHYNFSESNPDMGFIMIASKRSLPKRQPFIASRPINDNNIIINLNMKVVESDKSQDNSS